MYKKKFNSSICYCFIYAICVYSYMSVCVCLSVCLFVRSRYRVYVSNCVNRVLIWKFPCIRLFRINFVFYHIFKAKIDVDSFSCISYYLLPIFRSSLILGNMCVNRGEQQTNKHTHIHNLNQKQKIQNIEWAKKKYKSGHRSLECCCASDCSLLHTKCLFSVLWRLVSIIYLLSSTKFILFMCNFNAPTKKKQQQHKHTHSLTHQTHTQTENWPKWKLPRC